MPDDIGLDTYIRNLEKRIEKLETRELVRVSSWNVGTGSAAPTGDLNVDSDIRVAGDIEAQTNLVIGEDAVIGGDIDAGGHIFAEDDLGAGVGLGARYVKVDGAAGNSRDVRFMSTGSLRWTLRVDSTAEGGSNVGSNFRLVAWSDAGGFLSYPLAIERSTGDINLSGDIYNVPWTDYSGISNIIGWTSYTEKTLEYKRVGNLVFVHFRITGESDLVTASFTLPFTDASIQNPINPILTWNDSVRQIGYAVVVGTSALLVPNAAGSSGTWVNSGTKLVMGQFWYEAV